MLGLRLGVPRVSYFIFSLEKILSHSLTPFRDLRYFFSGSPEKKIQFRNFRFLRFGPVKLGEPPPKWQKNDLMCYIFEKILIHTIVWNFFVLKMVIKDLLSVFFFRESWEREKKNTAIFTHSLLFWDFHPKSNFSREKKIRHLWSSEAHVYFY